MKTLFRIVLAAILTAGTLCLFSACGGARKQTESAGERKQADLPGTANEDARPVILALGNSLTAGAGVDPSHNYPAQLQKKIDAEGYRYRVVNAGVSGDTSGQGLNRLPGILPLRPSIAIIELGANDGLRGLPVSTTQQNLESIIEQLQAAGAKVILAGMRVPPNYGPQYSKAFRAVFEDVAERYGVPLIPFFLEGVGGDAALNQDDGIHPTAEGYAIVVENVWEVLHPLL